MYGNLQQLFKLPNQLNLIKMKKFLFTLFVGFSSFSSFSMCQYPFDSGQPVDFTASRTFTASVRKLVLPESPATVGVYIADIKNVNARAMRDFRQRFNDPRNVLWFTDQNGFTSYFMQDGYGNRAFYGKNGTWQYSLIFYNEDKLPREIRAAVKSVYFDYSITMVEEVQTNEGMAYIFHLEDRLNLKILKVTKDGEMEMLQELTKEEY
jgi:hypothetical protein